MKLVFSAVEERIANNYLMGIIHRSYNNGLVNKLINCYSYHLPLQITPDEILNNILCVYAKYVNFNAEKFRAQFVTHEGKKPLTYVSGGSYDDSRVPEIVSGLVTLIEKDQGSNICSWGNVNFSTTTDSDKLVRMLSSLYSQGKYYEYHSMFCCGYPSVELLGTLEDWKLLLETITKMPSLDDFTIEYKLKLFTTVMNMLGSFDGSDMPSSEEFWQSCVTKLAYGSGGEADYIGWMLIFNPINEKGEGVINLLKEKDFLDLNLEVPVNVNDNGNEFKIMLRGGPSGNKIENNIVSVKNHFEVKRV